MEEKNDLNIMQKISLDNTNLRKYLIWGGGVFILFVMGVVISKFMFSTPKNDTKVILPTDIKVDKSEDTKLFSEIPVDSDTDDSFKKPVVEEESQIPTETIQESEPIDNKSSTTQQKPVDSSTDKQKAITNSNIVTKENQIKKGDIVSNNKNSHQKSEVKTPPQKRVDVTSSKEKKIKKETTLNSSKKIYFIQVAATRKTPSQKFLKLIEKNGFHYKIIEVTLNNMKIKRVLIGGYSSLNEVKAVLPKVKAKISSSAFIKRIK